MKSSPTVPAARTLHLSGGCRAIDIEEQQVELQPLASNGQIARFGPWTYGAAYTLLAKAGFTVLGADFYSNVDQTDGRQLPNWRVYHRINNTSWPCAEQADQWSFLAHAAITAGNGLLWDIASRIEHQLKTCEWRVRQLSDSYRDQLFSTVARNSFRGGQRFMDTFTWLGYLSIQAFLVDACVLRDYLAEYRALVLSEDVGTTFRSKISRMSTLRKHYLSKSILEIPVDKDLAMATDPGGWLYKLGSYRDLVVHVAPLANAGKSLYAVCKELPLDDRARLPSVKLPIPPDPEVITEHRSTGAYFDDPEHNYARFVNALQDPDKVPDGLEYSHSALGRLALLASQLLELSPVKPRIPVLTKKDIRNLKVIQPGEAWE